MKTKLILLALLIFVWMGWAATDPAKLVSGRTITVVNTAYTNIPCPLDKATVVQVYIPPSGTAQVFTIRFPNATTAEVPSGGYFTLRTEDPISLDTVVFEVVTATGSTPMQVIGFKEKR